MTDKTKLEAEISEALSDEIDKRYTSRADLVRAAHTAAAMVFVGKPKLTDATIARAKEKAFRAVQQRDRLTGTSHHPHAAYSHGIATLAAEGVEEAIAGWRSVQSAGGAAGVKRRHGIR